MRPGRYGVIGVLVAIAALAGAGIASVGGGGLGPSMLLVGAICAALAAPSIVRLWSGRFDPFEPTVIIAGVYVVYFVLGPVVRMTSGDFVLIGRRVDGLYEPAFVAVLLAIVCMWLGYALPLGRFIAARLGGPSARTVSVRSLAGPRIFGWGLTGAAVIALGLWSAIEGQSLSRFFLPGVLTDVSSGGGTSLAYLFLAIEWFIPAFLVLSISGGFATPVIKWLYFAFVSVAYTSLGFRYRLVIFWVAALTLAYLRRGKRPSSSAVAIGACVVVLFAGWLGIARTVFKASASHAVITPTIGEVAKNSLSDTEIFETFATVLDAVPDRIDYAGAAPLLYVVVQPVPRALWPEKPYPTFLDKIGQSIGTDAAMTAGAAVPHFGEYYLAFGWPGLVLGMVAFGVGARTLWEWFLLGRGQPWRQVIFAMSNAFLVQVIIRGYTAQIVQEWFFIIFPAVMGMYIASAREPVRVARVVHVGASA